MQSILTFFEIIVLLTGNKNPKHWSGDCGVGIRHKEVTKCIVPDDGNLDSCQVGEKRTEYCVKANCFDYPLTENPEKPLDAFKLSDFEIFVKFKDF